MKKNICQYQNCKRTATRTISHNLIDGFKEYAVCRSCLTKITHRYNKLNENNTRRGTIRNF